MTQPRSPSVRLDMSSVTQTRRASGAAHLFVSQASQDGRKSGVATWYPTISFGNQAHLSNSKSYSCPSSWGKAFMTSLFRTLALPRQQVKEAPLRPPEGTVRGGGGGPHEADYPGILTLVQGISKYLSQNTGSGSQSTAQPTALFPVRASQGLQNFAQCNHINKNQHSLKFCFFLPSLVFSSPLLFIFSKFLTKQTGRGFWWKRMMLYFRRPCSSSCAFYLAG